MPKSYDYFSEIIEEMGIPLEEARLIRHAAGHKSFKECFARGEYAKYTGTQAENRFRDVNYLFTFIGESGGATVFHSAYEVVTSYPYAKANLPDDFPGKTSDGEMDTTIFMELREISLPDDIESLSIAWGKGFRSYIQRASTKKEITEITYKQEGGSHEMSEV